MGNFFVHFFSWQLNTLEFFFYYISLQDFFFTDTYALLILFCRIYATKNSNVALLNYISVQLYTRYITDSDIKLIHTGAEKSIEFVECTELELEPSQVFFCGQYCDAMSQY